MKRIIVGIILAIILIFIGVIKTVSCISRQPSNIVKSTIGVKLPKDSEVLRVEDTHDGFHGDGESYIEVLFTDKGLKEFIQSVNESGKWLNLPLEKELSKVVYGGYYDGVSYEIGKLSKNISTDITNGMYYFIDRFAQSYPEQKDKKITARYAFNLTVAILDFDNNKLYIYELDT